MSEQSKPIQWPQVPRMSPSSGSDLWYAWHRAINQHSDEMHKQNKDWPRWMYDAKHAADVLPRLALLFNHERTGQLPKVFRKCSCCCDSKHVEDNHLTCCLGTECRKCEHLAAIDKTEATLEQKDWVKAWTCVGHILANGGDMAGEGFVVTVDDRMFWDSVNNSLAST